MTLPERAEKVKSLMSCGWLGLLWVDPFLRIWAWSCIAWLIVVISIASILHHNCRNGVFKREGETVAK